jgi:hypothetical protein
MAYSQEQMEFAHKVVFRLMEILKVCPNVDEKYKCHTAHQASHARCVHLMFLLAEITNLPEYLEYLGNNDETSSDPYGWITSYPAADEIYQGTENKDEKQLT